MSPRFLHLPTWDLWDYSVSGNETYSKIIAIAWESGHTFHFFKSLNCYILATTGHIFQRPSIWVWMKDNWDSDIRRVAWFIGETICFKTALMAAKLLLRKLYSWVGIRNATSVLSVQAVAYQSNHKLWLWIFKTWTPKQRIKQPTAV